ncbi:MAG: Superoxide dismutase [Mn] [uncultured Sphingomonadaceae bacterium]|uniref:Superoxide dismutase n=1 Tax=uncultured Sphingomonadaceae bacterium TaxID=169976 RepID=A0A6J4T7L9_9SPHN|nr:MAG: Superoxide dismutase [Mn] [uncultured Sphingomonadaceae bacterium]
MTFQVAPLPYDYAALEPTIDAATMRLHHQKHHQTYVDNLNKVVEGDSTLKGNELEALLANVSGRPAAVRNNGGGHWNHSFFWEIMGPGDGSRRPEGGLGEAIGSAFGSFEGMQEQFNNAGVGRFGSGWVWLVADASGGLRVTSTQNQDNPLMDVAEVRGTPILGNDVWEHAYYLTYNNRRADYLKAWWKVVNWDKVQERYAGVGR